VSETLSPLISSDHGRDVEGGKYVTRDGFGKEVRLDEPSLAWGYHVLDPDTPAAWGARFITQGSFLDLVWDRQSTVWRDREAMDELIELLNGDYGVIANIRSTYKTLHKRFDVCGWEAEEVLLADGRRVKAVGNTNASHGYFYVAAWLKGE
tara:strand:- start:459 stop:911 length:453 start_codon:yes stop_codon:yes gene_type:complete